MSGPSESSEKRRYASDEVVITTWKFPYRDWSVQVTAQGEAIEQSGQGYVVLSLSGAAALWRDLTQVLRDRGVIA